MTTPLTPKPPTVDVREAARLLQCAEKTVRRLIDRGKLDAFHVGRSVRIERASIVQFIHRHRVFRDAG